MLRSKALKMAEDKKGRPEWTYRAYWRNAHRENAERSRLVSVRGGLAGHTPKLAEQDDNAPLPEAKPTRRF